jgi:hypothetical protein
MANVEEPVSSKKEQKGGYIITLKKNKNDKSRTPPRPTEFITRSCDRI